MKQKNLLCMMGILSAVLVFGMMVVGCGEDPDSGNTDPKSITITGLTGQSGSSIEVMLAHGDDVDARGNTTISSDSITVDLEAEGTSNPWTGSGSYFLILKFDNNSSNQYFYTTGKTFAELGISSKEELITKLPKIAISEASTTVAFNQFQQYPTPPPDTTPYTITITQPANGTLVASSSSSGAPTITTAIAGDRVYIEGTPANGYILNSVTVNNSAVSVSSAGTNLYRFTMPASNVTVTGTFVTSITLSGTVTVTKNGETPGSSIRAYTSQDFSSRSLGGGDVTNGSWTITMPSYTGTVYFAVVPYGIKGPTAAGSIDVSGADKSGISLSSINITTKTINGTMKNGSTPLNGFLVLLDRTVTSIDEGVNYGEINVTNGNWSREILSSVTKGYFMFATGQSGPYYIGKTEVSIGSSAINLNLSDMNRLSD